MSNGKKRKTIMDILMYAYIRNIKKWMYCPACQQGKMTINKKSTLWTCEDCGYKLSVGEFEDDYVLWFCDECGEYLNIQDGFDKMATRHTCSNCRYENDITFNNIKGICSDCGKTIPDPDGTLCIECKVKRKEKAKEILKTAGKAVGVATAVVGAAYLASQSSDDGNDINYTCLTGENGMRCANCGNTDESTLWDEGDTIYCSICAHRTTVETEEDDVVECPYCHRMRDRKALYCRYCNDSTWQASTEKEFEETDKLLKEMGY